jgi:hypothetical protein
MKYWVFHAEMLAKALAAHEAARQRAGASEQQAKDDTQVIIAFLGSAAAREQGLVNDDGRG